MKSGPTLFALGAFIASVAAQSPPTFTQPTEIKGHFVEQFTEDWSDRWSPSKATKEEKAGEVFSYVGKWSVEEPTVYPGIIGDEGLVLKSKAAHHAISVPFDEVLDPSGKPLVVQYEVKLQKLLECGGAYIKLLTDSDVGIQAEEFSDQTPYTIMFGPDRCGATSKVHFIFRHKNPLTGEVEEKHLVSPPAPKITKTSALYTLIVRPDQSYEIKINNETVKTGSLLTDFSPAVNPAKEIDDPADTKPEDWVESPKIADPEAVKPEDWDEEAPQTIVDESAEIPDDWLVDEEPTIPDPEAEQKPEEWSDEDDGDWIAPAVPNPLCEEASGCGPWSAPEIPNPAYKGKWFAPLIDNPEYKGVWAPKKMPNPDYFYDESPANFNKIAGIGIELWSMTEDILFDNIYVGTSEDDASALATETFLVKKPLEDALEAADKPATPDSPLGEAPDYKVDPVGFAKFKSQEFMDLAVIDPKAAFESLPYTAAALGTAFALALGLLTVLFSSILPKKKTVVPAKKSTAVAEFKKTDDPAVEELKEAVEEIKEAPIAGKKEEASSGPKTRASKKAQ
ncbi:calnexin [Pseudohyphozyma bogoriensis]|nr:calnexin [Pseudohyphozyma bogoriensis]